MAPTYLGDGSTLLAAAAPAALAGLVVLVPIVLFYLFVRRRPRVTVAYLAIWQRVAEQHARRGWLRWLVSLVVALATAAALVTAASGLGADDDAEPSPVPPRHVVVLLDTSPSNWADGWASPESRAWADARLRSTHSEVRAVPGGSLTVVWEQPDGLQVLAAERLQPEDLAKRLQAVETWYGDAASTGPDWPRIVDAAVRRLAGVQEREPTPGSVRWLLFSDGKPLLAPWQLAPRQPGHWHISAPRADDDRMAVEAWCPPVPAGQWSAGITRAEFAEGDGAVTLAVHADPHRVVDGRPPLEVAFDPPIAAPIPLDRSGRLNERLTVKLPANVPPEARRGSGGADTWQLTAQVRPTGAAASPNARPADATVTLTVPVVEPAPVVVLGPHAREPLLRLLLSVLRDRGHLRLVTRQQADAQGLAPVVLLAGLADAPRDMLPANTRAIIAVAGPHGSATRLRPGNALRWSETAPADLHELADRPLTVREARPLPAAAGALPLLFAGDVAIADWQPGEVPRVRFGFDWTAGNTDLLAQPSVAPVLLQRVIGKLAAAQRSPLPAVAQVGDPVALDVDALRQCERLDADVVVTLPGEPAAAPVPMLALLHSLATRPRAAVHDIDADGVPGLAVPAEPRATWVPRRPGTVRLAIVDADGATVHEWRTEARLFSADESGLPPQAAGLPAVMREVSAVEAAPLFDAVAEREAAGDQESPPAVAGWPLWQLLAALALLLVCLEAVFYRLRLAE